MIRKAIGNKKSPDEAATSRRGKIQTIHCYYMIYDAYLSRAGLFNGLSLLK